MGRGLNGPFHLLNKNNESLLVNQVSIYNSLIADTFMIMVPGLNGVDGTVSLLLSDFPKYCIFSEGETFKRKYDAINHQIQIFKKMPPVFGFILIDFYQVSAFS